MPVTNGTNFARTRAALRFAQHQVMGNVYFVDSVAGSATGGYTADGPAATLVQGQTLAAGATGDTVFVSPEHAESITGAAGMTFSQNGVIYQGLGTGRNRPTITFSTSTAAQMIVSGANITFRNIIFNLAGVDQIVAAISVTGADVAFEDCEFLIDNGTNASVILGILTAATAARFRVERCRFLGAAAASTAVTACIKHEVGVDFVFRANYFRGKMTQAILNATTILGGLIDGNYCHVCTGTKGIALAAGTTGMGVNNRIVVPSGTAPIVGAGFSWVGNLYDTEALTIGTPTASAF